MKSLLKILFLNELKLICLHTDSFKYGYLILIILFDINYLFAHS